MKANFADRRFQLWLYRVSHGELLVRSPKDADHPRNVDILFAGVEYVELPRFLPGLEIDEPDTEDLMHVQQRLGRHVEADTVVVLKSQGYHYVVVASTVRAIESDMDIFDSPFE